VRRAYVQSYLPGDSTDGKSDVGECFVCHVLCMCSSDAKYVQQICQSTLHDFNLCMFRQESEEHPMTAAISNEEKPNRLSNEMVFKITVICLAMIHVMQKDGEFHSDQHVIHHSHSICENC